MRVSFEKEVNMDIIQLRFIGMWYHCIQQDLPYVAFKIVSFTNLGTELYSEYVCGLRLPPVSSPIQIVWHMEAWE